MNKRIKAVARISTGPAMAGRVLEVAGYGADHRDTM